MIIKIDKGNYYIVKSNAGKKILVEGDDRPHSEATELKDHPKKYREID